MSDRFAYDLEDVDSVMVGTVGPPGRRSFLLQAVRDGRALTVSLEKEQAAAMAAGLEPVLIMINAQEFTKTSNCWGINNQKNGTNTNRIVLLRKP